MSYSLLLLSLSPPAALIFLSLSLFSLRAAAPLPSPSPPSLRRPTLAAPLALSTAVAVFDRNSISTGPPLSPTYLPLPSALSSTFSTSPITPPCPLPPSCPCVVRETLSTRERKPPAAFRAINYAAQLFTGISRRHCLSDVLPTSPGRRQDPARRDVNTKTGDFKWPA